MPKTGLSPRDSQFVQEMLIFEPLPFVERVIFCSTPHRGSEMAASRVGKIGISMIKLPDELQEVGKSNSPESSDGVVGYWSSQLDGAASETIVPSDHSSHRSPEGVAELVRILHLHLDEE